MAGWLNRSAQGTPDGTTGRYSLCSNFAMVTLAEVARESDGAIADARSRLVRAVREASAQGMTQQQIARAVGRSQPEVSRLLRFHGTSALAHRVRKHRAEISKLVEEAGGSNVRVFGSVAEGTDDGESDVDLLFTKGGRLGLMGLSALENEISDLIGAPVDLMPESAVRPGIRERVLKQAVPL